MCQFQNGYLQDAKEKDQEPDGALVSRAAFEEPWSGASDELESWDLKA